MIRPHRISDWNVFYGMTGKTDYAKQMGKFVLARLLFEILIVLPFRIANDNRKLTTCDHRILITLNLRKSRVIG